MTDYGEKLFLDINRDVGDLVILAGGTTELERLQKLAARIDSNMEKLRLLLSPDAALDEPARDGGGGG
jgi:hypothetical protein